MHVVALVSGGKDSIFSILECISQGHQVIALVNMQPLETNTDQIEIDSYMYQSVGAEGINYLAKAMSLPLYQAKIKRSAECSSLTYQTSTNDEVEDLFDLLKSLREDVKFQGLLSGAILSNYQRQRIENICSRLGLTSLAYLWRRSQKELLLDMIAAGVEARIIKIASFGLDLKRDLGSTIEEFQPLAFKLADDPNYALNPCGEGGEFETFTFDCPIFTKRIVPTAEPKVIIHSTDACSTVAYLRFSGFALQDKKPEEICVSKENLLSLNKNNRRPFKSIEDRLRDLHKSAPNEIANALSTTKPPSYIPDPSLKFLKRLNFSPWAQTLSGGLVITKTCFGFSNSLRWATQEAFSGVRAVLARHYMGLFDVIQCQISTNQSLEDLDEIIDCFSATFDEEPPTLVLTSASWPKQSDRNEELVIVALSCIAVLPANRDTCRESMCVRSISHWVPAIGPSEFHSQAIRLGSEGVYSGIIGLLPETLQLPPPLSGFEDTEIPLNIDQECWLCLRHVHRIMTAMESGGWKCLLHAVVYATSLAVLRHARRQFHNSVCTVLSTLEEKSICFCTSRVVWAVVKSLPRGAAVQWHPATSSRLEVDGYQSVVSVTGREMLTAPANCRMILFKAGMAVPRNFEGSSMLVDRFLGEDVNFVCLCDDYDE